MAELFPNAPREYLFSGEELVIGMQRELDYRHRVFPRLVEKKTMSQAEANRQIALVETVIDHLQATVIGKSFKRPA